MGKQIIRLTENDLHKVIKESVKRIIKERELGADEKFTPYTPEEAERNRKAYMWGTPEERNPSYAKAKAEAAARRKSKGSMEEGLDEIGNTEKGQDLLGRARQRAMFNHNDRKEQEIGDYAYNQRSSQPQAKQQSLRQAHQNGFANQWDKYHK